MKFDLSRVRFDARKDFLGVVMQQGRVQLDSDWNEWAAQLARRIQSGSLDTYGGNVVPRTTPDGFRIEAAGGALSIGPGRMYVDGLLAENHGGPPDAWETRLAELGGTTAIDYDAQPYYPDPEALPDGGAHLVYLDVWQRDITALQDPSLIEPAIGIDTTGRLQTAWQVRVHTPTEDMATPLTCATPDEDIPGWAERIAPSAGRLTTGTGVPGFEPDPCQVPPAAGYRGLENQLYRVEVHTGGPVGTATFKWSRDNATVVSRVTHINPARDRITVESIGRDDVLRFNDGDWVEVTDDWRELHGLPGELRRIRVAAGVDEGARTLSFDDPLSAGLFPTDGDQSLSFERNTRVRRWDQAGTVRREDGSDYTDLDAPGSSGEIEIPAAGTELFLEHGILVSFDTDPDSLTGEFRTGDYWVFAARSADASVEELTAAPPLGDHHHYARLAVVDFPDDETDCRTLWPPLPEAGGEGCDCTVCVDPEGHNSGEATIQQAVDAIKDRGGTICLAAGEYRLEGPVNVSGAGSLRIRGQGLATFLVGSAPGGLIDITRSTSVVLENLSVIGTGGNSGIVPMVSVRNTIEFRAEHINVLGLSLGDGVAIGIGLTGVVLGCSVSDCAIVAARGIAALFDAEERNYLLTGELRASRNLFFCRQHAVSLDGNCLHFGTTRFADSLLLNGDRAAVIATGAMLEGSSLDVQDNVVYTSGDGIVSGVDSVSIEGNELGGLGERSGHGVALVEGLDPVAVDRVRIAANRIRGFRGDAIAVGHRVGDALITDNQIDGLGGGALVMSDGGAADHLRFAGNHCLRLGEASGGDNAFVAALQIIRAGRGDVLDNVIGIVGRSAVAAARVYGLVAGGIGQLRIDGNRFFGIGPDRSGGEVAAIRLLPPFDRSAIEHNHVDRIANEQQKPSPAAWRAVDIAPLTVQRVGEFVAVLYVTVGESAIMLTPTRAVAAPQRRSDVAISNNQLRGHLTGVPLNRCAVVDHCLFAENHCETPGNAGGTPLLGEITANTVTVVNNRLVGVRDFDSLHLQSAIKQVIVTGNISTGPITVLAGAPVPADITLTNIFGA